MSKLLILSFLVLSLLVFTSTQAQETDDDALKIESSLVVLNATITDDRGKPALGLDRNLFTVLEDGVEQEIDFFEAQKTPFAAVILLDTSGSMEQRISLARSAAISFLDGIRSNDLVSIYSFDSEVNLIQDFSNSRDLHHRVFDLKADGWTALNDAVLRAATDLAARPEKRKAIIVLSDGADTRSRASANKALEAAIAAQAVIYTVDMSSINLNGSQRLQNIGVLKKFSEKTGGLFIPTPGGIAMREAFQNIVEELGIQYTLGYQPRNVKKDGKWRRLELRVKKPNLVIRTRTGYRAPKR